MKKIISLILAVIMIFSVTAMAVSAADETQKPIKVTFKYDKDDGKGIAIPAEKVIYVDYNEDFTKKAPQETYIQGGWKFYIEGWSTDDYGPAGKVYTKLPTIPESDGITEITFTAQTGAEEVTVGGVIGDAADTILGEDTVSFFTYIIEQIKVWLGKLLLLFGSMM